MAKTKKAPIIEHLEIDETYYIENDRVRIHLNENYMPQQCTWDEAWEDALKIILKTKEYDETHN